MLSIQSVHPTGKAAKTYVANIYQLSIPLTEERIRCIMVMDAASKERSQVNRTAVTPAFYR